MIKNIVKVKNNNMSKVNLLNHSINITDELYLIIPLTVLATRIIDHPYFQRMRHIKQLGTCNFIFPNAIHTRFQHSLGTYHLAGKMCDAIRKNTNPDTLDKYLLNVTELREYFNIEHTDGKNLFDDYVIELIKIGALCHDLGHGAFSHIFDDEIMTKCANKHKLEARHETRSGLILDIIVKNDEMLSKIITDNEITFIKNIIDPSDEHTGFIYQMVSNSLNGIDVDKLDYLPRDSLVLRIENINPFMIIDNVCVIDENIVYSRESLDMISEVFHTRHRLHKKLYRNIDVVASQFLVVELLNELDKLIKLTDSINDMNVFCKLTDSYIMEYVNVSEDFKQHFTEEQIIAWNNSKIILDKLNSHTFLTSIAQITTEYPLQLERTIKIRDDKDMIVVYQTKIGYVSGNKSHPLDNINVTIEKINSYEIISPYLSDRCDSFKINRNQISTLISKSYQEYITFLYYKNPSDKKRISELQSAVSILA